MRIIAIIVIILVLIGLAFGWFFSDGARQVGSSTTAPVVAQAGNLPVLHATGFTTAIRTIPIRGATADEVTEYNRALFQYAQDKRAWAGARAAQARTYGRETGDLATLSSLMRLWDSDHPRPTPPRNPGS